MIKDANTWKLSKLEIVKACEALTEFISAVVLASEPFKVKAKLIRAYKETAKVEVEGQVHYINQRYCYFGLHQQDEGADVYVDNRYLQDTL